MWLAIPLRVERIHRIGLERKIIDLVEVLMRPSRSRRRAI